MSKDVHSKCFVTTQEQKVLNGEFVIQKLCTSNLAFSRNLEDETLINEVASKMSTDTPI